MKFFYVIAFAGVAVAFPGMANLMADLAKRQEGAPPAPVLIGDLVNGATTPVGNAVKNCLLGTGPCQNTTPNTYKAPLLISPFCLLDTCCVWSYVSADLVKMFTNADGTCNAAARTAVRLGFHDAAAWSTSTGPGGADGSIILSLDEILRPENNGLQNIRTQAILLLGKYGALGVNAADLVQFMHNVATVVCPLGPRINTYVGRKTTIFSNLKGLIPDTHASAQSLVDLFANKTINFKDLIALIGAHTTAQQFFVDPSKAGQPLDSTPGVWDVEFYSQALTPSPPAGVFRLPSDQAFVNDPETNRGFGVFSGANGQAIWNAAYSVAYVRMSLLGVNNINKLTDCTKVLPDPKTSFP